ncbi:DUF3093 domain-containing protein [Williamsia sterculiae]|uniref:DUF3093 domain-containing protein n=1 Tax=Williamsia sterculiae TaxID=1344003 RepID=A0A1N7EFQ4_9NOCA|nr:DUF3093 domain-containing protein [Williamsia sterculiae]SIR86745.1 Protein of unknown function [Williamsia sterculiae]
MAGSPSTDSPKSAAASHTFDERLRVPLWWWPAAAVVVAVFGYEIQISARHMLWSAIAYPLLAALAAWMLWSMGRTQIRVAPGADGFPPELFAHRAHLPVSVIARAGSVPATAKSAALGRQLDPAAYLVHKFWVKTMVLLVLDDPDDPTPYWLVSTRHPERLITALGLTDAATR